MKKLSWFKRLFMSYNSLENHFKQRFEEEKEFSKFELKTEQQLDQFQKQFNELYKQIGELTSESRNSNKSATDKLEQIARVMVDKKARGRFGELQLETILHDAFGEQDSIVKKQYKLNKGGLVDVALEINGSKIIPIDSKFPKEYYDKWEMSIGFEKEHASKEFEKQVKEHIKKVSNYIDLNQTTPFSLVFIPSESIFAEIQSRGEILEFSQRLRTYFVSPTSLLATVTVASQIKDENYKIKNLPKIINNLRILAKHIETYKKSWEETQKSIEKAYLKSMTHTNSINKIESKISQITDSRDSKILLEEENE